MTKLKPLELRTFEVQLLMDDESSVLCLPYKASTRDIKPGMEFYCKERWCNNPGGEGWIYEADYSGDRAEAIRHRLAIRGERWWPANEMPRDASRSFVRAGAVVRWRLDEVLQQPGTLANIGYKEDDFQGRSPAEQLKRDWEAWATSSTGLRPYRLDKNPEVILVEYERVQLAAKGRLEVDPDGLCRLEEAVKISSLNGRRELLVSKLDSLGIFDGGEMWEDADIVRGFYELDGKLVQDGEIVATQKWDPYGWRSPGMIYLYTSVEGNFVAVPVDNWT